jgi:hypothetical protein
MAGNYWIKFYVEILDDPKMATLSDHLWRRFYELCLIAGRQFEDGNIPSEDQIAWTLRSSESDITDDLLSLEKRGLITKTSNGFNITNFKKRQDKMTPADKMSRYREEQKRDKYYQNTSDQDVTLSNTPVTQITDNRIDTEKKRVDQNITPANFSSSRSIYETNYQKVWFSITGMTGIPATDQTKVVDAIDTLRPKYDNEDDLVGYLKPYYDYWLTKKTKDGRPYSKSNCAWLYDLAIAGDPLPTDKKRIKKPDKNCQKCNGIGMYSSGVTDIHDKKFGSLITCDCLKEEVM